MSDIVTIEEQEAMGIRRPRQELVKPVAQPPAVRRMSEAESAALQSMTQGQIQSQAQQAIQLPAWEGTHTGHVRHVDDPLLNVAASLRYSSVYILVVAIIIGALLILATIQFELGIDFWTGLEIEVVATGLAALFILYKNRGQGLHHSATGIAHAEIKAKTQMFATQAEVEIHRIDADKEVRLAEVELRRDAVGEFVKQLGRGEQ